MVVDFSSVNVAGGTTLSRLLELRESLEACGGKLVLCSISPATRGVFTLTRLDEVFDLVEDRAEALAHLQVQV